MLNNVFDEIGKIDNIPAHTLEYLKQFKFFPEDLLLEAIAI